MIDYLRLSVTDRCNLNCMYCAPLGGKQFLSHEEVLRYEEIARLVKIFVKVGIRKVRITGGEPLIKKNILDLITMLKGIDHLEEISLTTNGVNLDKMALSLKTAGVDRINISLDTLRKKRFKVITGCDVFESVWEGIQQALEVGFSSVKVNVIPMRTINDDEIFDFVQLSLKYPLVVRFIELFSTNESSRKQEDLRITNKEVEKKIEGQFGGMKLCSRIKGNGPAQYYEINGAKGVIGFISNFSRDFCGDCSRVRVDCAGRISPCLFSGHAYDARPLLRNYKQENKLLSDIKNVILMKSKYTKETRGTREVEMSSLGG